MKVLMTSGKEFEVDFESNDTYQQLRAVYDHMKANNQFQVRPWAEDREDIIAGWQKAFHPGLDRATIMMVVDHHYSVFKAKFDAGEIDEIDQAIFFNQTVLEDLDKWVG